MKTRTCTTCKNTYPETFEYFPRRKRSSTKDWEVRAVCKPCWNEAGRYYRSRDPEKSKARYKKYYLENLEKERARNRDKKKRFPEQARKDGRKRRALIRGNDYQPYTEQEVLDKYGTNCYLCGYEIDLNAPRNCRGNNWEAGLHIEHLVAICNGGPDNINNVRPSHAICNLTKGVRDV